jgi:hypothetical protein
MNHLRDKGILILFVMLGALFWQPVLQATAENGGRDIIFYYSNDVHGETEPCG